MKPLTWLKNTLRNGVRNTPLGRVAQHMRGARPLESLRVVSATRLTEKEFWKSSALGKSLKIWMTNPALSVDIQYQNADGLPHVYNRHLRSKSTADVLLFIHDDVWLDDPQWLPKLFLSLQRFDIVGVAGNTRISPNQPAWLFNKLENDVFHWDRPYLSGAMGHGSLPKGSVSVYGPTPARCQLLDGAVLAVRSGVLQNAGVKFDECFAFHLYDMDFCRAARQAGLSLGTWPISLTHQSSGSFSSPAWREGYARYRKKWRT